jgi:uncharacterized membrane protein YebE (DUF533 family)
MIITDVLDRVQSLNSSAVTPDGTSERALSVFLQSLRLTQCAEMVRRHGGTMVLGCVAYSVVEQQRRPWFSVSEITHETLVERGFIALHGGASAPVARSLLLLRALIAGAIAAGCSPRTLQEIAVDAGERLNGDARACLGEELMRPLSVAQLASNCTSQAVASKVYLASALAAAGAPVSSDGSDVLLQRLAELLVLENSLVRRLNEAAAQLAALPDISRSA